MQLYEGPPRLEFSQLLGRPIISGEWSTLGEADHYRVIQAIDQGADNLEALLGYYGFSYELMVGIGFEWVLTWFDFARRELSQENAVAALRDALNCVERFPVEDESQASLRQELAEVFSSLPADPLAVYRAGDWGTFIKDKLQGALTSVIQAEEPGAEWDRYFCLTRSLHDLCFLLAWGFGSAVKRLAGEEVAARGVHLSLTACSFYEMAWDATYKLSPKENVVALAEHLRAHFSGPLRQGSVEVVEEEDRFRIVLDCCGSGGNMRRKLEHLDNHGFEDLSGFDSTWGRKQVPIYCAHCACNEIESVKRLGYPLFSTEFEPDPQKPCGWTVFKNPEAIPEERFRRLGARRAPETFKPLPLAP